MLKEHEVPFVEYDISEPEHMHEVQRRLPRTRSIPQLFVDGEHIGNEVDLKAWLKQA